MKLDDVKSFDDAELEKWKRIAWCIRNAREGLREDLERWEAEEADAARDSRLIDRENAKAINRRYG